MTGACSESLLVFSNASGGLLGGSARDGAGGAGIGSGGGGGGGDGEMGGEVEVELVVNMDMVCF